MYLFTQFDIYLLVTCMTMAAFGGLADWLLMRDDWATLPPNEPNPLRLSRSTALIIGRVALSLIAGAVVWLLLVDSMLESKGALARAALLAGLAGFCATDIGATFKAKVPGILRRSLATSL